MKNAIYNPNNKPEADLPTIFGFNNGGQPGWMLACLIAEDGTDLGSHVCTCEGYMPGDLGVLEGCRPDRHKDQFQPHYPDGYKMEFVGYDQVDGHEKLMAAIALANAAPVVESV